MPWRRWRRRQSVTRAGWPTARRSGSVQTIALEGDQGTLLVTPAAPGSWLLVLVEPDANFGQVLYDLRRHRSALATLL